MSTHNVPNREAMTWGELLDHQLRDAETAMSFLKAVEEDAGPGEMVLALQDVITRFPELAPIVIPAYTRHLTPQELEQLAQHEAAAEFVAGNRPVLLRLMAPLAEAS